MSDSQFQSNKVLQVWLWPLATIVLTLVVGCQPRQRRTPDDTLVVLIEADTTSLDPRFAISNYDTKISRLVCPGLMTVDQPSLEPALALAESIEMGPDEARVVLRKDAKFADGRPVTAADVVYTFRSVLDAKVDSPYHKPFAERFREVIAEGPRRLRLVLQKPVATLASDLDFGVVAARGPGPDGRFRGGIPMCAGPYYVKEWSPERTLLWRNPHYYGAPAKTEKVLVRTVRDENARGLMLAGGSADIVQNAVRVDLVGRMARRERLRIESGPGAILTYLMMHNEDPVLRDVRVRQAIALAIDRQTLIAAKLGGRARLATGMLPTSHWAYEGDVVRYGYDPARSKELLDAAGYPHPDGPGRQPRLRLSYKTSANQFRLALARIIASQLAEVGIEVDVRAFEFHTFFSDIKQGNYQLASMQTSPITEPDYLYTYFHSARIPTAKEPSLHNRWRYRNHTLDRVTEMGRATVDRKERLALYSVAQKILALELPVIPLWHEDVVAVVNTSVRGYRVLPSARFAGLQSASKAP